MAKRTHQPARGKVSKRPKTAAELLAAVRADARRQWDAIHVTDDGSWPDSTFAYLAGQDEQTRTNQARRARENDAFAVYASLRSALVGLQAMLEREAAGAGECERFLREAAPSLVPLLDRPEMGQARAAYWQPMLDGLEWSGRDSIIEWAERPLGINTDRPRDPMGLGRPANMRELALIAILAGIEPTMHPGNDTIRDVIEREEKRMRKRRKAWLDRCEQARREHQANSAEDMKPES